MASPTLHDHERPTFGRYRFVTGCDLPTVPDMARHTTNHIARTATVFGLAGCVAIALTGPFQAVAAPTAVPLRAPAVPAAAPAAAPALTPLSAPGLAPATVPAITTSALTTPATRAAEARRFRAEATRQRVRHIRARVVEVARKQLGDRYSAGGNGPDRFDCSGLTQFVFRVAAGKSLPHQSRSQYSRVKRISRAHAQPGDLVFFFRGGAHHVGIYIGKGRMIDARGYGEGVKVSPITGSWWGRAYSGIGRVLPAAS